MVNGMYGHKKCRLTGPSIYNLGAFVIIFMVISKLSNGISVDIIAVSLIDAVLRVR